MDHRVDSHVPSDVSDDADSDLEELQGDIAKFDESVRQFLASHHGASEVDSSRRGGPRGRGARGPRKAAKPRGDITARLAKVNQAFLAGDYDRALDLAFEVIRINAETHQAWTALSSTFAEIGDTSKALSAMVYAAHLRPKDVTGWIRCASYALDSIEEDEAEHLHTARLCYSAALRAEPQNLEARSGKASVCHRQGHLGTAVTEYTKVLKSRPRDIDIVRRLAEACMDARHAETAVPTAISAYRRFFELTIGDGSGRILDTDLWYDVGVYVEMFAYTGRYKEAIHELKRLARWLVGRGDEKAWDEWQDDEREWDLDDARRSQIHHLHLPNPGERHDNGARLPPDLRARLAIYRFRLGQPDEALHNLSHLEADEQETVTFTDEFPYLAFDLACSLAQYGHDTHAKRFLESLRAMPGDVDPAVLLQLGRCNLALGDSSAAEECFLAAIDADEMAIEPRIELANMYERAKEGEEALILAAEAMAIREAQGQGSESFISGPHEPGSNVGDAKARQWLAAGSVSRLGRGPKTHPMIPRRYRPKRLADPTKRLQEEQAHAVKLAHQYQVVKDLKQQIADGRKEMIPLWMTSSKDLIDDFRSLKRFYTWDKYLHFLGSKPNDGEQPSDSAADSDLARLYQRLARNVAPYDGKSGRMDGDSVFEHHQGISFDQWLELFLDYAIALAVDHHQDEAYRVCESARDSTVFQSAEHNFSIHVAWTVCAICTSDEGKAITLARHLMRDMTSSDGSRLYALLANLCQSPISWYTSGPAQKFILRQIKLIDAAHGGEANLPQPVTAGESSNKATDPGLDICLLMLYGHILFTSTSYTFALSYFLRARSIDPNNALVNLSLGLAYVHYGLKRQSANRQYILLQGQSFLTKYSTLEGQTLEHLGTTESNYNIGRLFQLLGISYLALEYYSRALRAAHRTGEDRDIAQLAMINYVNSLMIVKNKSLALVLTKQNLVL